MHKNAERATVVKHCISFNDLFSVLELQSNGTSSSCVTWTTISTTVKEYSILFHCIIEWNRWNDFILLNSVKGSYRVLFKMPNATEERFFEKDKERIEDTVQEMSKHIGDDLAELLKKDMMCMNKKSSKFVTLKRTHKIRRNDILKVINYIPKPSMSNSIKQKLLKDEGFSKNIVIYDPCWEQRNRETHFRITNTYLSQLSKELSFYSSMSVRKSKLSI